MSSIGPSYSYPKHPYLQQAKVIHSIETIYFAGVSQRWPPLHLYKIITFLNYITNLCFTHWALRPQSVRILEVHSTNDKVDLKQYKLPRTRMSPIYLDIYSNRYLLCRRRPPISSIWWLTTNCLYRGLQWNIPYRTSWLRFSSVRSQHAWVPVTQFSGRIRCSSLHWWPPEVL